MYNCTLGHNIANKLIIALGSEERRLNLAPVLGDVRYHHIYGVGVCICLA